MGNVFGMNSSSDDEYDVRFTNIERRVLELEQKVFLGHVPELGRMDYRKRFECNPPPPPPNMASNPMLITPLQNPNLSASFQPDPPLTMSWSR